MTAPITYRIETVADLLKVPADRRATMFRELELALLTHELAISLADDAGIGPVPLVGMDWTDDGDFSTHISSDGKPIFSVAVKKDVSALTRCAAGSDGDCEHEQCPQLRDSEPRETGRHCPLDA